MGGKNSNPPKAPDPVDPGESVISYLFGEDQAVQGLGVASPEVQRRILEAEALYGPQYVQNALARQEMGLFGDGEQAGLLDIAAKAAPVAEQMRADTMRAQREADISDVELFGGRATEALRQSDPDRLRLLEQQRGVVDDMFSRAARITPQQQRQAEQQAREAFGARGRSLDNVSIFGEALGREELLRQNRMDALGAAQGLFGQYQATSADPFQAILGRPAQALPYAQATGQQALGLPSTPTTFNPDAGVNLALQNNANQVNHNASVYGAQQARQGATLGGLFSGVGNALGGWFGTF